MLFIQKTINERMDELERVRREPVTPETLEEMSSISREIDVMRYDLRWYILLLTISEYA